MTEKLLHDLDLRTAPVDAVRAIAVKDGYRYGMQRVARTMRECGVPPIATAYGPACGAGCDGAWPRPHRIGLSRAAETGFALDRGPMSKMVAPDAPMDEARALAARIARNPPRRLRMAGCLLREGTNTRPADHDEPVAGPPEKRDPDCTGE